MRRQLILGLAAVAALVLGEVLRSTCRLQIVRLRVALPGLPEQYQGVRIAHLSDFHAGATGTRLALLRKARAAAVGFEPHIIALTGDYYDDGVPVATEGLWSNWPDGMCVVAVLGNHDFRGSQDAPDPVVCELQAGGIHVLRNAALRVDIRGSTTWIVGVDDPFTWRADESAAFADVPDEVEALLYLAHSPSIDSNVPLGRARLALCGHTHAGQVRLLSSGKIPSVRILRRLRGTPPRRDPPVYRGYHWLRGMLVLVSEGIGVSRIPIRFRTRPQVLLIELSAMSSDGPRCDDASRYVSVL